MISPSVYVELNRNFHSNVNVLGRFNKHFLASLYRSTLFDIFLNQTRNKNIFIDMYKLYLKLFRNIIFAFLNGNAYIN